jgi:hypothetical protein
MSKETVQELRKLLHNRLEEFDTDRAVDRFTVAVVRGATTGFAIRGGLNLASYLLRLVSTATKKKRHTKFRPSLVQLIKESLQWAAFLGAFSGTFVAADELVAFFGGRHRTQSWRAMAAGAAAGPTLLLTGSKESHTSLALYILIRGLALLVRCGNLPTAQPWKRHLLAPTRWKHGDVALVCLSTAQIGYSWIVLPETLPSSYVAFLNKHGGKPLYVYQGVRELVARGGAEGSTLSSLHHTPHSRHTDSRPCSFLHPGTGCTEHSITFLPQGVLRALPVYIPVYLIPAALVHRKRLLNPAVAPELWKKIALGGLRSSVFLGLYCSLAWRGACGGFQMTGKATGAGIAATCWVAGLATFVEKKSRRMELALYCVSRSLESFMLCAYIWGWIPERAVPKRLDVILFSIASAAICHCYSDHMGARRDVFKSKYLSVFDFVLGNVGFKEASVRHHPSNTDLLKTWEKSLEASSRGMNVPLKLVRSMRSMTELASLTNNSNKNNEVGEGGGRPSSSLSASSSSPSAGSGNGSDKEISNVVSHNKTSSSSSGDDKLRVRNEEEGGSKNPPLPSIGKEQQQQEKVPPGLGRVDWGDLMKKAEFEFCDGDI